MSDDARPPEPARRAPTAPIDRAAWLVELRRIDERQEDGWSEQMDLTYGAIEEEHRAFLERFLSELPAGGLVLDAPCGTGKYFGLVVASGRQVVGADHSGAHLARAAARYPQVATEKHDLQDLPFAATFDGVMCIDAMEFIPPEDWPVVLDRFRAVLRPGGWLYLTVERSEPGGVAAANATARARGLPVMDGEVIWDEPDGYYHHYPSMTQVRAWFAEAGFEIVADEEGPWHDRAYAYHQILARLAPTDPTSSARSSGDDSIPARGAR